ncbi:hypothetical protein F2P81_017478 [Scophthalmus maximus]|uniref:Uncharacterized protein n=1 Tax=Scophthalmus maximus TaxID=52904 RepID=A0A6A4SC30_SCOMX|nr:hypothetical protein F2P81_017478 [Scophthalmus maximus]
MLPRSASIRLKRLRSPRVASVPPGVHALVSQIQRHVRRSARAGHVNPMAERPIVDGEGRSHRIIPTSRADPEGNDDHDLISIH